MQSNKKIIIEIFGVAIMIIIFTAAFFFKFYSLKTKVRNNIREGHIAEIRKSLFFHKNQKGHFPVAPKGECIHNGGKVKEKIQKLSIVDSISADPVWPETPPPSLKEGHIPQEENINFCYWYVSNGKDYYLSYYLEPSENFEKEGVVTVSNYD